MFSRLSGILAGGFLCAAERFAKNRCRLFQNRRLEVSSRLCYC